jgi:predicted DNA-binding protein with PD1-like motif
MRSKLLHQSGGAKTFAVIFDTGDEVTSGLTDFVREQRIEAASFTAIGAFRDVALGYFDWEKKDYRKNPLPEQVEVLSLIGDVAEGQGGPQVHAHVVVGRSDGTACGGHLLEAHVRPTLEVVLTQSPSHLHKRYDPDSHLALIRF